MTDWFYARDGAHADDGREVYFHFPARPSLLADWYSSLVPSDIVWVFGSDERTAADVLAQLPDALTARRWVGHLSQGSLLSLRAVGGAEVRNGAALLPWLDPAGIGDVLAELADLRARGYAVDGKRGRPRLTVGAVAWATAAELCEVDPAPVSWGDYDAGRRAYYGGRCEVFRTSAPALEGWDISSAYPWALLRPVPTGKRADVRTGPSARRARSRGLPGAFWARIEQPRDAVPRVPWRYQPRTGRGRTRGPLMWVTGHVEGWWTPPELDAAEATGCKVNVGVAYLWEGFEPVWAPYVEHTASDRALLRARGAPETSAKLLANALGGKLAQAPQGVNVRVLAAHEAPQIGWSWHGGRVWSKAHRHVPPCARPIEAATMTAHVRAELLTALLAAGDRAVYCDTDSIWQLPGAPPPVDRAPWRLIANATDFRAPAPKTYRYTAGGETVTRASGVPREQQSALRMLTDASMPRRHPLMPKLPEDGRWAGNRRVVQDEQTVPLHRHRGGRFT